MNEFVSKWVPTEKDLALIELASKYHARCEAYDRTVCTGPVVRGEILPIGNRELALINNNARKEFEVAMREAESRGITRAELRRAIGRHL